jgi:RNA polymerase sigma-70 factor, ECF subfamily
MNLSGSDWERIASQLTSFVRRRVRDAHLAEDIVQDVLLKAHVAAAPSDARSLVAWLFRAARNAIVDYYRSPAARRRPGIDDRAEPALEPVNPTSDFAACVSRMVGRLPEPYRTALWLADHEGLTQADVAARLDTSLSGAKSRVQRARAKMREMIDDCCDVQFDARGGIADYDGCDSGGEGSSCSPSKFRASFSCAHTSTRTTAATGAAR